MSMQIKQAVNQVRLTNVAIVKYKRNGRRFEIACYKNKVLNWRNGVETDLDEVLQIDRVFNNVSKGVVANSKVLIDAFGTDNQTDVCKMILQKGELQVSDKERDMQYENMFKDIAAIVTEKCVNPQTGRPYPQSTIETAMKQTIHYAVAPSKSTKQQALDVIRRLQKKIPLARAKMHLKLSIPNCTDEQNDALTNKLNELRTELVSEKFVQMTGGGGGLWVEVHADPGHYRALDEFVQGFPGGSMEVKDFNVQQKKEVDVEQDNMTETVVPMLASGDNDQGQAFSQPQQAVLDSYDQVNKANSRKKKSKRRRNARRQQQQAPEEDLHAGTALGLAQKLAAANIRGDDEDLNLEKEAQQLSAPPPAAPQPAAAGKLKCTTCHCSFGSDRKLQTAHYKSDFHRLNLKLKSKNLPPVTDEEYELMGPEERDAIMLDYRVKD